LGKDLYSVCPHVRTIIEFLSGFALQSPQPKENLGNKKPADAKVMAGKVGAARFELATSWSQTRRDDRATLRPELPIAGLQK
jgi:hypothetical protein